MGEQGATITSQEYRRGGDQVSVGSIPGQTDISSPGKRQGLAGIPSLNDLSMGVANSSRPGMGNEISIIDNKRDYLKDKKRRDI